ncbi:MAG: efflux RND transporter periplasmic adaptor subunit [Pseudomonadota bacterium]|nr:efflux RND transporter periplasmic adaptor subunit [Pseudomonadota bacterium]
MTGRQRTGAIIAVIIIALVVTVFWFKRPKPVSVILTEVQQGEVERTVTNTRAGTLMACRRARLSPSIGGQIATLPVKEGDTVKQGELLFEIWNDDLRAERDLAQSQIRSNQARATEACVQADAARREANRLNRLHKKGLASEESADQAESTAQARAAGCEAARATVDVSRSQLGVAEAALMRTRLQAPFEGTVAEVNGEVGEFVTPSPIGIPTPPAVDLIDTTCLYVSAPIDEVDAPEIRPGMTARILLDAFSKTYFQGTVRRIAPYVLDVEKQARTVDVEVNFAGLEKHADLALLPGYSADIEVILEQHPDTLRIPTEALLEGLRVYVYDSDSGTIEARAVKTGLSNWQHTEILEGLQAGDRIVLSIGREELADGVPVKAEQNGNEP